MKILSVSIAITCAAAILLNAFVVTKVAEWWVWLPIAMACGIGLGASITRLRQLGVLS